MKIRYATPADADTIVEFNRALARETENLELDRERLIRGVRQVLADRNKGLYFIADEQGQPIGQTMITFEWSDWRDGWVWWIQSVYVTSEFRRHGVFRAIFDFIASEAEKLDVRGIRLYVVNSNDRAKQTYQSVGLSKTFYEVYEKDFVLHRSG